MEYEGGIPKRVDSVVIAAQHDPAIIHKAIEQDVIELVIREVIPPVASRCQD